MEEQSDKAFIKNISIVMVVLVAVAVAIAFIARDVGFRENPEASASRAATAEERVRRVADAYTGEQGATAIQEAASAAAPAEKLAFDGSLDGKMLYSSVCSACHGTGAAGAPLLGSSAMAQRAEKGPEALVQSVLNGLNAMPARGGRTDLSDEQVRAAVEFMLQ